MLFEPRAVVREYQTKLGRRKLDLVMLYDLQVRQGLTFKEIGSRLGGIPRSTQIQSLSRAKVLFDK